MESRSAGRAVAGFGAAEMVVGRVGARAQGVGDVLVRRGWERLVGVAEPVGTVGEWRRVGAALGWELQCGGSDPGGLLPELVGARVALMTPLNPEYGCLFDNSDPSFPEC
jgi:hypothetical protein